MLVNVVNYLLRVIVLRGKRRNCVPGTRGRGWPSIPSNPDALPVVVTRTVRAGTDVSGGTMAAGVDGTDLMLERYGNN